MKYEIREVQPTPPPKEVVLTVSPEELGLISWALRSQRDTWAYSQELVRQIVQAEKDLEP